MTMKISELFHICFLAYLLIVTAGCKSDDLDEHSTERLPLVFYIDSDQGKDSNDGRSESTAWETFSRIDKVIFVPGDTLKFKRGSSFNTTLSINDSGEKDKYIVLTSYGSPQEHAPTFTNTVFDPDQKIYGNCIRIKGSFIEIENLYFEHTVAGLSGNIGLTTMWELGALCIDKTADHCIVRHNEFYDCGVGVKSNGSHILITQNYIHDCSRVLKEWSWGPLGIWLGGDYQEVCDNRIFNYRATDPKIAWGPDSYGGGADGGAIEIDDGRVAKSHIEIHHNYTRDNQGFIEVTWTDVVQNPQYTGFWIHHNVCDDYQQFISLWCGAGCKIENNTIIRRKQNVCDWGVFNMTQDNSRNYVRNNLVVVENGITIFPGGSQGTAQANSIISHNIFYAASGDLNMGKEGPGDHSSSADPLFVNYTDADSPDDFTVTASSPAVDQGLDLGYVSDFRNIGIPQGNGADIGAFEVIDN